MVSKKVLKNIGVFAMTAMLVAAPALAVSANTALIAPLAERNVHGDDDQTVSGNTTTPTVSGNTTTPTVSGNTTTPTVSGNTTTPTVSGNTTTTTPPDESKPADSTPAESKPADSTPAESKPADSTTTESSTSTAAPASVTLASKAVVTASGVKLVSTVNGSYSAKSVDGVAVVTPAADVLAAFGATSIGSVRMNVSDSVHGPAATVSINYGLAVLTADGVAAVKGPELDLNAFLNGKKVVDINQPISIAVGIPASFRQAGYDYAVMLVQEGGRVSILPNLSTDPNVIAVNSKGFGVYVLIKAPAGSFDKYK